MRAIQGRVPVRGAERLAVWRLKEAPVRPVSSRSESAALKTVLVVDDDLLIQDITREELEEAGYQVIVASNADEAVAILEARQDIHLVVTDVEMPGSMDGLKLAAAIRDRWPPVHIIVTSGKLHPLTLPTNTLFIPKPHGRDAVVAAIRMLEKS